MDVEEPGEGTASAPAAAPGALPAAVGGPPAGSGAHAAASGAAAAEPAATAPSSEASKPHAGDAGAVSAPAPAAAATGAPTATAAATDEEERLLLRALDVAERCFAMSTEVDVAQRRAFVEGKLLMDDEPAAPVGLKTEAGRVVHATVDGDSGYCLVSHATGRAWHVYQTVRDALYGDVALAKEVRRVSDGVYSSTEDFFAVKRMSLDNVINRARGSARPMQEDPLKEVAAQLVLSHRGGHPNVARATACVKDTLNLYLVQPHLGTELFQVLTNPTITPSCRFHPELARQCFRQLLDGLEYMHSKAIAHLDVSLENIVIDHRGRIALIDFGLCRVIRPPIPPGASVVDDGFPRRALLPTRKGYYVAPEIMSGEPFSAVRVDLWAAATVLFLLLTGLPAVDIATESCRKFQVLRDFGAVALMRAMNVHVYVPDSAQDLLQRMLAVNPTDRPNLAQVKTHPWVVGP